MRALPQRVGEHLGWAMPYTLGHETAGWVHSLGAGATGLAEGDGVALVAAASCGACWFCLRGMDNCCPNGAFGRGYGRDGGLADYVLVDNVRGVVKLESLDPRTAGPLTDAGATAYHAVRRALPRVHPGGTVVVLGVGGLGAFAVQFLRILTAARVVAVDTNPDRLGYAREIGAHETLTGVAKSTIRDVLAFNPFGADAVLDFVGTDATIKAGVASTRPGGAYGLVGAAGGTFERGWFGEFPRDGEVFTFQGGTVADAQEVISLASSGLIRNEVEEFPFDRVDDAYTRLADGTLNGRAVVVLDK
jgi:propanol-preferring alcohol dehydrogenase